MRRKRSDSLVKQRMLKRIAKKIAIIALIIICFILSLYIFFTQNKEPDITYIESGSVDYNVSILKNEFFTDSVLSANNQYISSILDKVNTNFKYTLQFNKLVEAKYKYRIEAETKIIEKSTKNNLYTFTDKLKISEIENISDGKIEINDETSIDYRKYDSMIKKIVSAYDLTNSECKTVLNMYVDLLDENENIKNTSKLSISIPLNVKTVNIETENSFSSAEKKIYKKGETRNYICLFLIIAIISAYCIYDKIKELTQYIQKNCPKEIIEKIKLKRILRTYKQYIQKINEPFDMSGYTVLRMESFNDILKIREMTQQPILMFENETQTKTYFFITTKTTLLYLYEVNYGDVKELTK